MCTMYRLFKKQLNFEDYLLSNYREWISLTKYRCANSKIQVYNQLYMCETELCSLCDLNVNGDEYHYIMICLYFRQSRELYLKRYFYTRSNMFKFYQLFSSENQRTIVQVGKMYYCYYEYNSKNHLHFIIVSMLFSARSIILFYCHLYFLFIVCLYVVNVYRFTISQTLLYSKWSHIF